MVGSRWLRTARTVKVEEIGGKETSWQEETKINRTNEPRSEARVRKSWQTGDRPDGGREKGIRGDGDEPWRQALSSAGREGKKVGVDMGCREVESIARLVEGLVQVLQDWAARQIQDQ